MEWIASFSWTEILCVYICECVCLCVRRVFQAPFGHHLPLLVLMATVTSCVVGNVHFTRCLSFSPVHTHTHTPHFLSHAFLILNHYQDSLVRFSSRSFRPVCDSSLLKLSKVSAWWAWAISKICCLYPSRQYYRLGLMLTIISCFIHKILPNWRGGVLPNVCTLQHCMHAYIALINLQ